MWLFCCASSIIIPWQQNWKCSVAFPLHGDFLSHQNDSDAEYRTQIALIGGTNWRQSVPGAECICLSGQKAARVPRLTSSSKPLSASAAELGAQTHFVKMFSDEATKQTEDVEEGWGMGGGGPWGKLSMKTDKNSAKQLIHSSVWLGEDLRDHETLSGEELGLFCRCLCYFVQLLDVLSFPVWQQHIGHFSGIHNNLFDHSFFESCIWLRIWDGTAAAFADSRQNGTSCFQDIERKKPVLSIFWAVFCSIAEASVSNEVKGFQPVHHSCKNAVDFTQALSVLGTVFVKLPVGAMGLYFVVLSAEQLDCGFKRNNVPFPHY